MRILLVFTLLMLAGCLKHTVREPQPEDASTEGKSDIRQLEDRLGV